VNLTRNPGDRDPGVSNPAWRDAAPGFEIDPIVLRTGRFALVGSFRAALGPDAWEATDPRHSRAIVREVWLEQPDFVALLGDLVFCGSSDDAWLEYDRLTAPLRSAGVAVYPALGNHEYWLSSRTALTKYFGRFPRLGGRRWYAARYGPLGLAFLDSNAQWLSPAMWREQCGWLERLLRAWDADEAVRGVLVLLHHAPFARARATADTQRVQKDVVPVFAAARKTLAMIAGHPQGEPRFEKKKAYLVASPRPEEEKPRGRRREPDPPPAFRWFSAACDGARVTIETRQLAGDEASAVTSERVDLMLGA
jgi:hypothetical protein